MEIPRVKMMVQGINEGFPGTILKGIVDEGDALIFGRKGTP
jgi:hypothetical protein